MTDDEKWDFLLDSVADTTRLMRYTALILAACAGAASVLLIVVVLHASGLLG